MTDERLTAEEAVEKALLFTFQLSNKDYRKMQTAMSESMFIRALEQDGYTVTALAATPETPTLDAAWAEAEAALPEGWTLDCGDSLRHPAGKWEAGAQPPVGPRERTDAVFAHGDTPAEALRNLAALLSQPTQEAER